MGTPKGYLTIAEAAERAMCNPRRIQELVQAGELPRFVSHADRRRVLIPIVDVDRISVPIALPERRRRREHARVA